MRVLAVVFGLCVALLGQENERTLNRVGGHTKHLTANLEDTWKFEGRAGETIVVHVESLAFDPVIRLEDAEGIVVEPVDGEGSESRFMARLRRDGNQEIKVHAFRHMGGGNYTLAFDRFTTLESEGGEVSGVYGDDGRAHVRFQSTPGRMIGPRFQGLPPSFEVLDPKGQPLESWEGAARVKGQGDHVLRIQGHRNTGFAVTLVESVGHEMGSSNSHEVSVPAGGIHVWHVEGSPGDLRWIEVTTPTPLATRLTVIQPDDDKRTLARDNEPDFRLLPVTSKGRTVRYAVVFIKPVPFEFQVRSHAALPTTYTLSSEDPSHSLEGPSGFPGDLAIGSAHFWRLDLSAGVVLDASVTSPAFDPLLRLVGPRGEILETNDDGGEGLAARIRSLVRVGGRHWLQVSSAGGGGGGAYTMNRSLPAMPMLTVGGDWHEAVMGPMDRTAVKFQGVRGQAVIVSARSTTIDPEIEVLGPTGVRLGSDNDGGLDRDSLLALRLPADGAYTLIVTATRGEGTCRIRVLDGD